MIDKSNKKKIRYVNASRYLIDRSDNRCCQVEKRGKTSFLQ